jgi:phosphoribosyl 1,2-cyclic phosphate phosphodiesterase
MQVTVLGCGSSAGVPTLGGADGRGDWGACNPAEPRNRRTRSSIVIGAPAGNILVDTGPDMRRQLLDCGISRVGAIIFTHAHADHVTGLDDVRLLNRVIGAPIPAYAMMATQEELERRFDYAFRPWEPPQFYRPVLQMHTVLPGHAYNMCGAEVQTFDQDHHVMHTLGLRVGKFAYSTDVVRLDDTAFDHLAGIDTWLVGCFQRASHLTHANIELVTEWRARLGVRRTVLTHMGTDLDWSWLRAHLPADIEPAFDGMILDVGA